MTGKQKTLILDSLFEGGRMFVGGTSIAYMLSNGVSIESLGIIKIIQALVFILGELPTGILGDMYGRKFSLLASLILGALGFCVYFLSSSLLLFCVAEVLVALSLCFWSGAYEAFSIDYLKIEKSDKDLNNFFHLNSTINKISIIFFGFLGGLLGSKGYQIPYLASFLVYILTIIYLLTSFKSYQENIKKEVKKRNFKFHFIQNFRVTFKEGILNPTLIEFFIFQVIIQASIVPLLHFWQPYFLNLDSLVDSKSLGSIFSLYVISSALLSALYVKLSNYSFYKKISFQILPFLLFSFSYYGLGFSNNLTFSIVLFCFCQSLLSVVRSVFSAKFNTLISSENRAGILSSLSLFSRFGSITTLGLISFLASDSGGKLFKIQSLFKNCATIYSISLVLLVFGVIIFKQKRVYA
ncbi:MFS transporter [Bacteriovoracales bacterium]|nr:MFS transporter [Bacteriovoracales bacterium]